MRRSFAFSTTALVAACFASSAAAETVYFTEGQGSGALDARDAAAAGAVVANPLNPSSSLQNPAAMMFAEPGPKAFAAAAMGTAPSVSPANQPSVEGSQRSLSGGAALGGLGPFGIGVAYAQRDENRSFQGEEGGPQRLSSRHIQVPLSLAARINNDIAVSLSYVYLAENRSRSLMQGEARSLEHGVSGYALQLGGLVALTENLSLGAVTRADSFLTGKSAGGERPRPGYVPARTRVGGTAYLDGPRPFSGHPWLDLDTFVSVQVDVRHTPQLPADARLAELSAVLRERPQASFRLTERGLDAESPWLATSARWTPRASLETLVVQGESFQASVLAGAYLEQGVALKQGFDPHATGGVNLSFGMFTLLAGVDKGTGSLQRSLAFSVDWRE